MPIIYTIVIPTSEAHHVADPVSPVGRVVLGSLICCSAVDCPWDSQRSGPWVCHGVLHISMPWVYSTARMYGSRPWTSYDILAVVHGLLMRIASIRIASMVGLP